VKVFYYTYLALKRWRDFRGVASRQELWFFLGPLFMFELVLSYASQRTIGIDLSFYTSLVFLIPTLAVGARRLHDINRSAWLLLIGLIPWVGPIALIVLWCLPSQTPNAPIVSFNINLGGTAQETGNPEISTDIINNEQLLCNNCGASLAVNDQFCPKCGREITTE